MISRILYYKKNDSAVVVRLFGTGTHLEMPDRVDGLTITEIADHCFAADMSKAMNPLFLTEAVLCEDGEYRSKSNVDHEEQSTTLQGMSASTDEQEELCTQLEEIVLSPHLVGCGGYAFYGCDQLHVLHIPATFVRIGGGAFVSCNHLKVVHLHLPHSDMTGVNVTPYILKDLLGELEYEVEVVVHRNPSILYSILFAGYYEESVEDTYARQVIVKYRGTGYKYRQCIQERQLNFEKYDEQFYFAIQFEYLPTLIRICMLRLKYPIDLRAEAKAFYLKFLDEQSDETISYMLEQDRSDLLKLLWEEEYFDEEKLNAFLDQASRRGKAQIVSQLMDYRFKLQQKALEKRTGEGPRRASDKYSFDF